MSRVRTNVEVEGVRTETAAIDLALRYLAGQPMTREEAMAMRGARAMLEPAADVSPRAGA